MNKYEAMIAWGQHNLAGRKVEWRFPGDRWHAHTPVFGGSDYEIREVRRTIMIGDVECPMGETAAPAVGMVYSIPSLTIELGFYNYVWENSVHDRRALELKLVYINEADAATVGHALVKLLRGK